MQGKFHILESVNILLIGFLAFSSCEFSFSNVGYLLLFLGIYVYVPELCNKIVSRLSNYFKNDKTKVKNTSDHENDQGRKKRGNGHNKRGNDSIGGGLGVLDYLSNLLLWLLT
ncbi:hypothetical protein DI09_453p10 [Mitosporidium daphniae]|uniref:Uncharacterized protein n=1 Tax=Mitosporidium daphniae TaxID=1485682 RepID=A0A098VQM0_9MICR|nr:uncharacterized protein DI09_453p10 [Mitosporidium daphniae]KGG51119.1 hypothetical protein DI09_453p10 [Mitosporidium daphniae]|eukprot:XP_013237555.1 uncharacterized protein DI09_453p10 [Mitosporidium daphniae]